jgi:FAD/FMN-containing dehydrogenase
MAKSARASAPTSKRSRACAKSAVAEPSFDCGLALLETRGGLGSASVSRLLAPRDEDEARQAFELAAKAGTTLTLVGARRSFEAHFLPPSAGGLALASERLKGPVIVLGQRDGVLRVRSPAGNSFGELLASVHASAGDYMPFSCPTAASISLGGALAACTHGRTTDTYGGYFADRVTSFRLVCPNGAVIDCSSDAPSELARRLYRFVPGSLGALGLVTEMELELMALSPRALITMQVLSRHRGRPLEAAEEYVRRAQENRERNGFRFSEGVSLVPFGSPRFGQAFVLARQRSPQAQPGTTLPLFDGRSQRNALLQALLHRFPAPAQWLAPRLLRPGRRYTSEYQRWAFFQDGYDDAAPLLQHAGPGLRTLGRVLQLDPKLTLVHQSWVMPRSRVIPFLRLYGELLESAEYRALIRHLEFQDVLPLPQSRWPMNASYGHAEGSHIFTLSCRVLNAHAPLLALAQRFCRELSRRAHELGVVVQLIKQLHVDDELLRVMHGTALNELAALKREIDPDDRLRSRTLDRLLGNAKV